MDEDWTHTIGVVNLREHKLGIFAISASPRDEETWLCIQQQVIATLLGYETL